VPQERPSRVTLDRESWSCPDRILRCRVPSLSVRAFAELIGLPAYEYARILHEQKYPKQQPQVFRTPFYAPALSAIRNYYRAGNDLTVLAAARQGIGQLKLDTRRDSNMRVLRSFERSRQARRMLQVAANPRRVASVGLVELRLSLDMSAVDKGQSRPVYYNCRTTVLDKDLAHTTLEIAHWVLEENGIVVPTRALEYIDLTGNRVHRIHQRRGKTLKRLRQVTRFIEALWPTI
jgi:hypothetical protein